MDKNQQKINIDQLNLNINNFNQNCMYILIYVCVNKYLQELLGRC